MNVVSVNGSVFSEPGEATLALPTAFQPHYEEPGSIRTERRTYRYQYCGKRVPGKYCGQRSGMWHRFCALVYNIRFLFRLHSIMFEGGASPAWFRVVLTILNAL